MSARRPIRARQPALRWLPRALCVLLAATAACGPAVGADESGTTALTLENIFRANYGARSAVLSLDGQRVAVVARRPEGSAIHLSDTEGNETRFWLEGTAPAWGPGGDFLVFLRDGVLWRGEPDSAAARAIVEVMAGLREPRVSPDGGSVAFYSTDSGYQDIWLIAADGSGEPRQITRGSMPAGHTRRAPAWSPDGRRIAYISNKADYWADDIWVVDVESGEERIVSRTLMAQGNPAWAPGGDRIAIYATGKSEFWYHDLLDIYLVDPGGRDERRVEMTALATGDGPIWSKDGAHLFFPVMQRGEHELWSVPVGGGVATRVTNMGGAWSSVDGTGDAFALTRASPTEGSDVWYLTVAGGPARRITQLSTRWQGAAAPIEVSYRSFDGLYIQGFLYHPPGEEDLRECPALVQVHGGGTNSYLLRENLIEQYLSHQGYVVLAVNYRGGSGFGREFQDLAVGDVLGDQALDAVAAADYLRSLPYTADQVGIYGGSYGGMMSMAAITRAPEKFAAAVPTRGIYSGSATFDMLDRVGKLFIATAHGGTPEEVPEAYEVSDVISRADRIQTPLLLMHGEADARAPVESHHLLVEALRRHGKEFDARTYPGEGHGFRDPANQIDMYERLTRFFGQHLSPCRGT